MIIDGKQLSEAERIQWLATHHDFDDYDCHYATWPRDRLDAETLDSQAEDGLIRLADYCPNNVGGLAPRPSPRLPEPALGARAMSQDEIDEKLNREAPLMRNIANEPRTDDYYQSMRNSWTPTYEDDQPEPNELHGLDKIITNPWAILGIALAMAAGGYLVINGIGLLVRWLS